VRPESPPNSATAAEFYQLRADARGRHMEHMLTVMRTARESLRHDDAAGADAVLRECLEEYDQ
jgi:hypothetical protein